MIKSLFFLLSSVQPFILTVTVCTQHESCQGMRGKRHQRSDPVRIKPAASDQIVLGCADSRATGGETEVSFFARSGLKKKIKVSCITVLPKEQNMDYHCCFAKKKIFNSNKPPMRSNSLPSTLNTLSVGHRY